MTTFNEDGRVFAADLAARLPASLHARLDALASTMAPAGNTLHLIVLGSFSVGKSSLLNMLLEDTHLYVAKEEATSLPTFIEYGPATAMTLIGNDGSVLPLSASAFRDATSTAPAGAACATLALPLAWLQGVTIADLPGLGSVSLARQQFTAAQVLQSDAVLYLLDPRGPGPADIETLRTIAQYGKRVKVMVMRWDEILTAQVRGEPVPDLTTWARQIEMATGLRLRLAGASRDGTGRDEVRDFVQRARTDLADIRLRRYTAEVRPLIENALGENALAQRACAANSESAAQALHTELMQRKQELFGLKSELYQRQQDDKTEMQRTAEAAVADKRRWLGARLLPLAEPVADSPALEQLQLACGAELREAVAALATTFSSESARYGALALPDARLEQLNIRVPPLPVVDSATFVETAGLAALERAVLDQQSRQERAQQQLAMLPKAALGDVEDLLHEKLRSHSALANQPLEYKIEVVPGNGAAQIGRMVGELADVALIFANPATAATKAGAIIAKGAKVVKVAVEAEKVAIVIQKGMEVAQSIKRGPGGEMIPPAIREKLALLECLSLGYWGEKIGAMLGGAPKERLVIDQEARALQQQAVAMLEGEIQEARRALAHAQDISNERQLTGWAQEQSARELVRLEQEILTMTERRALREQQAQAQAAEEHRQAVRRLAGEAIQSLLASYDGQSATMADLLAAHVAAYWENEIDALLEQRLADIDALAGHMQEGTEAREATLATLRNEAQALTAILEALP